MRSIGRNVQRFARVHGRLLATESCFHFTFEQDEGLLEVVPMRWWSATWRDVHIDYAETSIRIFARHGDSVGIAYQTDVRKVVGMRQFQIAFGVVRRNCRLSSWHVVSPWWDFRLQ
jgi:hypothetical protein